MLQLGASPCNFFCPNLYSNLLQSELRHGVCAWEGRAGVQIAARNRKGGGIVPARRPAAMV